MLCLAYKFLMDQKMFWLIVIYYAPPVHQPPVVHRIEVLECVCERKRYAERAHRRTIIGYNCVLVNYRRCSSQQQYICGRKLQWRGLLTVFSFCATPIIYLVGSNYIDVLPQCLRSDSGPLPDKLVYREKCTSGVIIRLALYCSFAHKVWPSCGVCRTRSCRCAVPVVQDRMSDLTVI